MTVPLWISVLVSCPYFTKWLEMKARKTQDYGRVQEPGSHLHMEATHGGSLRTTVLGSSKLLLQSGTQSLMWRLTYCSRRPPLTIHDLEPFSKSFELSRHCPALKDGLIAAQMVYPQFRHAKPHTS